MGRFHRTIAAYSASTRSALASDRAIEARSLWPVWASSCLDTPDCAVVEPATAPAGLARQAARSLASSRSCKFFRSDSAGSLGGETNSQPWYEPDSGFFF